MARKASAVVREMITTMRIAPRGRRQNRPSSRPPTTGPSAHPNALITPGIKKRHSRQSIKKSVSQSIKRSIKQSVKFICQDRLMPLPSGIVLTVLSAAFEEGTQVFYCSRGRKNGSLFFGSISPQAKFRNTLNLENEFSYGFLFCGTGHFLAFSMLNFCCLSCPPAGCHSPEQILDPLFAHLQRCWRVPAS